MRQEYQRLQGLVDEAFLDADQDRDGKLTRDEFEEWYFVNMVPRPSCAKSSVIPGPSESPSTARTGDGETDALEAKTTADGAK